MPSCRAYRPKPPQLSTCAIPLHHPIANSIYHQMSRVRHVTMLPSPELTDRITSALAMRFRERGLKLDKLDTPVSSGYTQEWRVRDCDNWGYAAFGIVREGYQYSLANPDILPFEAKDTIDWIADEIKQITRSRAGDVSLN